MAGKKTYKARVKAGLTKEAWIDDAISMAVGPLYALPPSLMGLKDWAAVGVGFAVPYLLGKATGLRSLCTGAVATAATHAFFVLADKPMREAGKPLFTVGLNDGFGIADYLTTQEYAAQIGNGQTAHFARGVNDYIVPQQLHQAFAGAGGGNTRM